MRQLLIVFMVLVSFSRLPGQDCKPTYVWKTSVSLPRYQYLQKRVSDQIESILTNYRNCEILNRIEYNRHVKHRSNEQIIRSVNDLDQSTVNGLKTIQASWVVFSYIYHEEVEGDSIFVFNMSLEDLETTRILAKGETYLTKNELRNPKVRFEKIKSLFLGINTPQHNTQVDEALPVVEYNRELASMNRDDLEKLELEFEIEDEEVRELYLEKDRRLDISAKGSIYFGPNAKHSDATGFDGIKSMFLEAYNVVKEFPHGALLVKFEWSDQWELVGEGRRFTIESGGTQKLRFLVNDRKRDDNRGSFQVTINIH